MFKKILIVEDIDSIGMGVLGLLKSIPSFEIYHSQSYDDALRLIRSAQSDSIPFNLLISDLSINATSNENLLTTGEGLIEAVKKIQPSLKIIVFSAEERPYKIRALFNEFKISGFVGKGHHSSSELLKSIVFLTEQQDHYISPQFAHFLQAGLTIELETYDIELIRHLSNGFAQEEISLIFSAQGKAGSGHSSVEKRINKLKTIFKAKNTVHLISLAKDLGVI